MNLMLGAWVAFGFAVRAALGPWGRRDRCITFMSHITRSRGQTCYHTFGGPHWGGVEMIEEWNPGQYSYACAAHEDYRIGGPPPEYYPPPIGCETIRDDDKRDL